MAGHKSKKRRRAESFQSEPTRIDDARQRLAAFRQRMFELPSEDAAAKTPEVTRVQWKQSALKKSKKRAVQEEANPVPMVKFNRKKEKKVKKVKVVELEKTTTGSAVIPVPGKPAAIAVKTGVFNGSEQEDTHDIKKKKKHKKQHADSKAETIKVQIMTSVQAPQWHLREEDDVDPLEQALVSIQMKEAQKEEGDEDLNRKQKKKQKKELKQHVEAKLEAIKKQAKTPVQAPQRHSMERGGVPKEENDEVSPLEQALVSIQTEEAQKEEGDEDLNRKQKKKQKKELKQHVEAKLEAIKKQAKTPVQAPQRHSMERGGVPKEENDEVSPLEQALVSIQTEEAQKEEGDEDLNRKQKKKQKKELKQHVEAKLEAIKKQAKTPVQAPQRHSMERGGVQKEENDEVSPLEQALVSIQTEEAQKEEGDEDLNRKQKKKHKLKKRKHKQNKQLERVNSVVQVKTSAQVPQCHSVEAQKKEDDEVDLLEQALVSIKKEDAQKEEDDEDIKKKQKQKHKKQKEAAKSVVLVKSPPQWHSMEKEENQKEEDDEVDPLEQALVSIQKEIAVTQVATPPRKKMKVDTSAAVANTERMSNYESGNDTTSAKSARSPASVAKNNLDVEASSSISKTQVKKVMALKKAEKKAQTGKNRWALDALAERADTTREQTEKDPTAMPSAPSPVTINKRYMRKKSPKPNAAITPSRKTEAAAPRIGKPLIVSDKPAEDKDTETEEIGALAMRESQKKANVVAEPISEMKKKSAIKMTSEEPGKVPQQSKKNALSTTEKKVTYPSSPMPATQIAASLAEDAENKDTDMFLTENDEPPVASPAPERKRNGVAFSTKSENGHIEYDSTSESDESNLDGYSGDESSLFSRLIDSAAREQWELLEVGRLVRLFATEWGLNPSKTARFLRETCPELVSVEFLEGLGVNLSARQLIQVFEDGSGNSGVLMNKMASAVENGHLSVHDPSFVSALERRVALLETNAEVMELLHPLLESLSTVRDVGSLLKQLCEHWQLERTIALVQQVLLSNVFDDLDGNQDEILIELPHLKGRLDFPSRLHQDDVDENGNLKGFLADDDSDYSGEGDRSEEEPDESDSDDDEDRYEGETDSEEEVEICGRRRATRNQFIEDEADVGEEDEEEANEEEELDELEGKPNEHDETSSSSDSD